MEGLCDECGHVKKDMYPTNPRTGRVESRATEGAASQPTRRWCLGCYEAIVARTTRDKYTTNERHQDEQ